MLGQSGLLAVIYPLLEEINLISRPRPIAWHGTSYQLHLDSVSAPDHVIGLNHLWARTLICGTPTPLGLAHPRPLEHDRRVLQGGHDMAQFNLGSMYAPISTRVAESVDRH